MFWYWCPFLKDQDNDWARESVLFSFKMMVFSKVLKCIHYKKKMDWSSLERALLIFLGFCFLSYFEKIADMSVV